MVSGHGNKVVDGKYFYAVFVSLNLNICCKIFTFFETNLSKMKILHSPTLWQIEERGLV